MVLKFKNPAEDNLKKVMVYGLDGSGKSTFASNYCKEHNLNPVVIDIDDTNRTALFSEGRVLQLDLKTDIQTFRNIKKAIEEIKPTEFDTIIIDGVTSLLEMLTSDAKGLAKYSDRASRFNKILQALLDSGKNIIFIGQIDMEVIFSEEFQSPKAVIKVNSLVNEKYLCIIDEKGNFTHEVKKFRTVEKAAEPQVPRHQEQKVTPKKEVPKETFVTAADVGEPKPENDPVYNSCMQIKMMLEREGKLVTKQTMKAKVIRLVQDGILPGENKPAIIEYIQLHCPEELEQ